ncbi:MAG: restriction endonuclease subunit S, partial [Pseudohongiellaceae bacterium]
FNHSMSVDFLKFFFLSDPFQIALKKNIHGGVNQNVHAEDIKEQFIAIPPEEEQKLIAEDLSKYLGILIKLKDEVDSALVLLKERRSALISAAVTGKIDVRDWQAPEADNRAGYDASSIPEDLPLAAEEGARYG